MRNPAFHRLLAEIAELHDKKSHDYADADPLANLRKCEAFGIPTLLGILVRLTDKWSRIEQLAGGKVPKNESLRDSLVDNAVYSLLAVTVIDEQAVPDMGTIVPELGTPEPVGQHGYIIPEADRMRRYAHSTGE